MDIVIPLGAGSRFDNAELRYCLRGIEANVQHDKIIIVGERPHFAQKYTYIQAFDQPGPRKKALNIFRKIVAAIYDDRVSDDFIFFNDDHYILQPWTGEYYHGGNLKAHAESKRISEPYLHTIHNTLRLGDGNNFDIHCPIVYNKQKFMDTVGRLKWSIDWGYCIKSVYCWQNNIEGSYYPDMKIKADADVSDRLFFSSADGYFPTFLHQLFPKKSRYELN